MMPMKKTIIGLCISLSTISYASAQCNETELYGHMDNIKTEMKSLSFDLKSNNMASAVKRIDLIHAEFVASRDEVPYLFKEKGVTGDELAKRQASYQETMDKMIVVFDNLKVAAAENDMGSIQSLMKEVGSLRKVGHRNYKADC
jgi:soluble cytochrome b562